MCRNSGLSPETISARNGLGSCEFIERLNLNREQPFAPHVRRNEKSLEKSSLVTAITTLVHDYAEAQLRGNPRGRIAAAIVGRCTISLSRRSYRTLWL